MGAGGDRVDAVVIGEDCVLGGVLAGRGHDDLVQEGDVLGARHAVVTVHVAQGKHVVTAGLEVADRELAAVVGAAHALQRNMGERGVVQIAVQADDDMLHGLQVVGPQHDARDRQRVDHVACREGKRVAVHLVALVVVLDGIGEVDDIGCVLLQRLAELDGDLLAHRADHGHGLGRWRHDDLLLLVLEVDDFVKGDLHLLPLEVECPSLG